MRLRSRRRGSTLVAVWFALLFAGGAAVVGATVIGDDGAARRARTAGLVEALALSDPALFTEARYTRNPSLADLASAFQDGPASLDHFPTGSLVVAPRRFPGGRLEASEN
jgi:hypothetical protein